MENIANFNSIPTLLPPAAETTAFFLHQNAKDLAWGEMLWKARIGQEYQCSFEKLCSLARQYMRTNHSAQDLVADLFAEALKWPLHKQRNIKNLGAYLSEAVKNRSINSSKRKRLFTEWDHSQLNDNISPHNDMSNLEHNLDLETLLRCIAARQAEAFRLYFAGYSHEEIVIAMQLDSVGASKNLVYRAKMKMKELFLQWTHPDPDDDGGGRNIGSNRESITNLNNNVIEMAEPSFEDILMFIEGTLSDRTYRHKVLKWILFGDDSMSIVSGLQKTIRHCHNRDVRLYFSTIKSALKEQLFDPFDSGFLWSSDLPEPGIGLYSPLPSIYNIQYYRKYDNKYPDKYIATQPASPPTTHSTAHHTLTPSDYNYTLYDSTNLFSSI